MTERRKLAHDVRNGMNTMLLNMQCLRISKGSDAIECLDAILSAADSVVVLIDQLDALPHDPTSAPATS